MKQKHKRVLTRAVALAMTLCLSVQLLPTQALAVEYQTAQMDKEIENLRDEVADLEQQAEELLGYSLQDVYSSSEDTIWNAYSSPALLTSTGDVIEISDESAFAFDAATGTVTGFAANFTAPSGYYSVSIPSTIGGVEVTAIGGYAFDGDLELKGVTLPDSIKTIGNNTFQNCTFLESMTLPDDLETIGNYAFENTVNLTGITELPASVTSIGYRAFSRSGAQFTEMDLSNVETVGDYAFVSNTALKEVFLPADISGYGSGVFSGCTALTTVTFAEGAAPEAIPDSMFNGCTALADFELPETVTSIGNYAFQNCALLGSFDLSNVTGIGYSAFRGCSALTSVSLNEGVTLGDGAFAATGLVNVTLPDSITELPDELFEDCTRLVSVTANALTQIGSSAFDGCTILPELPDLSQVTSIGAYAFVGTAVTELDLYATEHDLLLGYGIVADCANLKKITLHGNYKAKGEAIANDWAKPFSGTSEDLTFVFDGRPTAIGSGLFQDAPFVKALNFIPDSVTEYWEFSFAGTPLTEITIPKGITNIKAGAFSACESLVKVTVLNDISAWKTLYAYEYDTAWGNQGIFKMGFFVDTPLADLTVADDKADITFPEDWDSIPHGFFAGSDIRDTEFLTKMPNLKEIEAYAFNDCDKLENLVIPEGVETIDYRAFYESMGKVKVLTIPASVTALKARTSSSIATQYTQHFYNSYSSALTDVYIHNPNLDLHALDFNYNYQSSGYVKRVFPTYSYSTENPLRIHGAVNSDGTSTAKDLCDDDVSGGLYTFEPLGTIGKLSLTVMAGEEDVTDLVDIEWKNSSGVVQSAGPTLYPHDVDLDYTYTLTLPQWLLADYAVPEIGKVTSGTNDQNIVVELDPIPAAAFTIKAPEDAYVSMTQKINGMEIDYAAYPDETGSVTFDAKQVYTEVFAFREGFYARTAVVKAPAASNAIDFTGAWKSLPATAVAITATSVLNGVETAVADLSAFTFTVKDSSGAVVPTTLQGGILYPADTESEMTADEQLTLEVSVPETSDLIAPDAPIAFTFADGTVNVPFTSRGHIRMEVSNWSASDPEGFYLWVFDQKSGDIVDAYNMYYGFCETEPLPEGTYTVVAIDMSVGIRSVPNISALSAFGLNDRTHYKKILPDVFNGRVTDLGKVDVPDYETFGGALYVDMFESAQFDSTVLEPSVGQNFILTFDYAINDTYASTVDKQIILQLPAGTHLRQCYPPEGKGSFSYNEESGLLTITTSINKGQIYLSLMPKKTDNFGSVTATAKINAYTAKPVSLSLPIKDIYIEAYDVVDGDMIDRKITVHTGKNATVMLYVNGEPYQVTNSDGSLHDGSPRAVDSSGKAVFAVTLPGPASPGTRWELTATATVWDGYETMTYESQSVKVITCSPDPFHVQISTQKPWCYDLPGGRIDFHSVDGATRAYWMTYCKHYTWGATVAPGMGKYIKDGTIYLKLSLFRDGPVTYLPLKATRSGGDSFSAVAYDIISHGYVDYYFDVTDEYYTEYLGQPVLVEQDVVEGRQENFAEEIAELKKIPEYRIELTEEEMSKLTDEERAAELSFQAALRNLRLTFAEYIPDLDMDTASDAEVLEAMGITVRDLGSDELAGYANNKDFTPIEVENADGSTTMQYTYADQTKSIVVDAAARTITTMDYTVMQQGAQSYALRRTTRGVAESAQSVLQEASNKASDATRQLNSIDAFISSVQHSLEDYAVGGLDALKKDAVTASCAAAKKVLSKAVTVLNFFEWGSMIGEGFSLNALSDAAMAEWQRIFDNGGEGLADPTECMRVLENLATAYGDLATAIAFKVIYLTTQLVMIIASIAVALPSGGISVILSLLGLLGSIAIDASFDANIDRARQSVDRWLKQKSYACRPDEKEGEDDVPCRSYMDPSGYVYEAVFSNPVEGLEVTAYMKEQESDAGAVWDAAEFGQENPLTTNGVGFYRWDVPAGYWNVVVSENADYHAASSAAVYSEEHMREGRTDITADGWHQVLPIQTEVHIPVVSKHAPTVDEENTIPWSDGILVQFSQYMKEETVKDKITVTMGNQTFTGEDLVITWPNQELSDHYYNRTFASQLMIARADGETWLDEVTVTIAGGENYAGTALSTWTETMDVVPVIAEIASVEAVEVEAEESTTVTFTLRDASGNVIPGVPVTLSTGLYATLPDGGNDENRTLEAVSDANGRITVTVQGHYPGEDLLSIAIPGRSGTWSIPIRVGSAAPLVAEPVVTINGVNYSGQGHVVTVEKGTVITVTGTYGDDLWYSIGESTCPCTESEQLYVRSGQLEITESGYYKFAAERDGVYSSRVHITIEVTAPTVHELVVSLPSLTPRTNDVPYDLTIESINGGTDKLEKFDELYVEERRSSNGGTYWTWYDWRRSDQQSADNLNGYYSMMMYKPVGDNVNPSYQFVSGAHYALIVQLPLGEEYADMPVARDCVLVLTSPIGEQRLTGEIVTEYSQDYLQFAVYYEKSTLLPEAQSYTNTLVEDPDDNGYISTDPGYWKEIKEGTVVTVTAYPYSKYWNTKAVSVTLEDGTPVAVTREDETTFTFVQPDGAVTISAEYGPISDETFSVTVNQPDNGTITVSPAEPQVAGTEITVSVAVQEGYKLNDWNPITVTDSTGETLSYWEDWSDGEDKRYCFEMPLGGATVSAAVKPITYDIYPWVGDIDGNDCDYGTITVTPEEAVLGETVTVTVTADEGYLLGYLDIYYSYWDNDIEEWVYPEVDYTYTGEDGVYTFTQPHSPDGYVNVYAYLIAERDRTVTVTQPANGSITVSPLQPYPEEEVKIKVEPDDGYEVTGVTVTDSSGEPVDVTKEADGTYTYTQPEGIVSISAVIESESGTHTHDYQQIVDDKYLVSAADCEYPAVYHVSCSGCDEAGTETFTYGEPLGHDYSEQIKDANHLRSDAASCREFDTYWYDCSRCAANARDDANASDKWYTSTDAGEHSCNLEVPNAEYLNTAADCENAATYFKSCLCGEKGTETFSYGTALGHTAGTAWEKDATHHWHICTVSNCGKVIESSKAAHTPDHEGGATEEYAIKCSVCGYVMEQQLAHSHVFDKQKTDAKYLKSAADCENAAVYYFSCTCEEAGTTTFTYGDPLGHTEGSVWEKDETHHWHICTVSSCGKVIESSKAAHTPDHEGGATENYAILCTVCGYVMEQQLAHSHVFDKQKTDAKYLNTAADCENAATYFKSCLCGEKGTETFSYGAALGHTAGSAWEKDATHHWHICTVSSCGKVIESSKAAHTPDHEGGATENYAILCTVCGYVMEQQLAHSHVFDKQKTEAQYLKSAADCENAAVYYLSCACGEAGATTFTYGSALGHTHSQEWKKNQTNHWHECSCGDKAEVAAHEYGSDTICDVCGYRKSGGGSSGGGGGGSASATYTPAVTQPENGSISVSPEKAEAGDTVTVTVTPDKGYTLETLTVTDRNGKEIKITAKDGKYIFTMPASKVTIQATFMEDNTMLNFFVDVPATAYYYDAVLWAAVEGITSGTTATTFSPNNPCTRAQMATFLWRAAGSPEPVGTPHPFTDIPTDAYYAKAVQWAYEKGITGGTSATTYSPDESCTRAQMATFLWRNAESQTPASSTNQFADIPADKYYAVAVQWAYEQKITSGTSATTYSPDDPCTRAQMVTFLYRFFVK